MKNSFLKHCQPYQTSEIWKYISKKMSTIPGEWRSVIGLEVHAQILANSKLFSRSGTSFGAPVNTQVSLFDCGTPGTLPTLNKRCVEAAVLTGLALNCRINSTSEFDRKHYFYADLPTGYQITQQRKPIAQDGFLDFVNDKGARKRVHIKQLQLEQDSGKSLHDVDQSRSLIDLNRAGVALIEIVFEPELSSPDEAAALVSELVLILRKLRTCDCKMDEGSLRVDANISVHRQGEPFGVRTEVKNLNSIRAVSKAVAFEIERQTQILASGGEVVNETRGFDAAYNQTLPMRDKEVKQDYRYMPEPNLPPLRLDDGVVSSVSLRRINVAEIRRQIPILPSETRNQLVKDFGLPLEIAAILIRDEAILDFFMRVASNKSVPGKKIYHAITNDFLGRLAEKEIKFDQCKVSPEHVAEAIELLHKKQISNVTYLNLLEMLIDGEVKSPKQIVLKKGWMILSDTVEIERLCKDVMEKLPKAVADYRRGKKKAINALAGQVKSASGGLVDMKLALEILKKLLEDK